ncbi:unnamed protein product [Chironomus riparius]|uniref:CG8675-PA n=1 Tax=Chironomus riparius TaxID=315576 RepID=A0A9N9RZA1_9DIPT|nr:unnamed protein product [Chironomus riparius]
MSSKRGDMQRVRAQKHQNKTIFKNDLHDNSDRTKKLNAMSINEVCQHCSDVIQWKIRYRKYKALTKPSTCNKCNQRNVKKAYHVLCRNCALSSKQCAKCLKTEEDGIELIPPEPTAAEKLKMDIEFKHMIKCLSERKRRTFLRYMNGKKKKKTEDDDEEPTELEERPKTRPTREQLLDKLAKLKVSEKDEDFYGDINSSGDEYEDDGEQEWESDDEENTA